MPMAPDQGTASRLTDAGGPLGNKTIGPVYLAVLVCVAGGLLLAWLSASGVRWGAVLAGAALVVASPARLLLPGRLTGMLGVRHRYLDSVALLGLGLGMVIIGLFLPPPA